MPDYSNPSRHDSGGKCMKFMWTQMGACQPFFLGLNIARFQQIFRSSYNLIPRLFKEEDAIIQLHLVTNS